MFNLLIVAFIKSRELYDQKPPTKNKTKYYEFKCVMQVQLENKDLNKVDKFRSFLGEPLDLFTYRR